MPDSTTTGTGPQPCWHTLSVTASLDGLGSDAVRGLDAAEVARRSLQHGPNRLQEAKARSAWRMLLDQFSDFMILVLIAAAILAGLMGDMADTIAIVAILLLNASIGFTQELRAARAMNALRQLAAPQAMVRRSGSTCSIDAGELVPGDIVMLEAGNLVPADLRLLECASLQINEAALTGESLAAEKTTDFIAEASAALGDQRCMAFKGTLVAQGRGTGVVVATGMQTQLGRIASLLENADDAQTPLQKRLAVFGKRLALGILGICLLIFAAGLLRGEAVLLMLLTAVSLAVAAIPESLPAVVTIALALGAFRLTRHQALMRRLSSVETLGSITWICSDKTGTLTENRMHVDALWLQQEPVPVQDGGSQAQQLFTGMLLCNDAVQQGTAILGESTEVALLAAALQHGSDMAGVAALLPRIGELPFDSVRMRMTTFHQSSGAVIGYTKGAPEAVITRCSGWWESDDKPVWDAAAVSAAAAALAAQGMRVLAFAAQRWPALPDAATAENELRFIGLAGLIDPPRAEAAAAIAICKSAGITPVMITGDHPATAGTIAARLGLTNQDSRLLTGDELQALGEAELASCVDQVRVYARMDPAQKIRIVKALQARGEYVAMTGDGINDAPALRQADIGVAMGRIGTDVAREASDMILLDDNFATIVAAIRGGRHIYDNIRRFIRYILTTNLAEVLLIMLAPLLGLPLPLLPIQILWINLVTDGLPGLALTMEPAERNLMQRPPRPPGETLFAQGLWQQVLWTGLLMAVLVLATQNWSIHHSGSHWQTIVFTTLTFTQLGNVLVIRSDRDSLLRLGLFSNPVLLGCVVFTIALQLLLIYVPWFNGVFRTQPLTLPELLLCGGVAVVVMLAVETEKWLIRAGLLYRTQAQHTVQ
jgi:Ca2+-transporting ATPase